MRRQFVLHSVFRSHLDLSHHAFSCSLKTEATTAAFIDLPETAFFYVPTQQGHIEYFGVEEWRTCARYRHACGVRGVYCDIGGARACVADERRRVHVYCPAADDVCALSRTATGHVRSGHYSYCPPPARPRRRQVTTCTVHHQPGHVDVMHVRLG